MPTRNPPSPGERRPNPVAARLAARSTFDVEGLSAHWRCRALSPTEAVELSVALGMLQTAISSARSEGEGSAEAPPPGVPRGLADLVGHMEAIACAVVVESSESGKTWHPIRLVRRLEDQDVEAYPPRLYVGAILPKDLGKIAGAATTAYREARKAVAPFRP